MPKKSPPRRPHPRDPLAEAIDLLSDHLVEATGMILDAMVNRIFTPGSHPDAFTPIKPSAKFRPRPKSKASAPAPDSQPSLYDILGLSPRAAPETIAASYKALAKKYHPDISKDPLRESKIRAINEAHGILSDPHKRKIYDKISGLGAK